MLRSNLSCCKHHGRSLLSEHRIADGRVMIFGLELEVMDVDFVSALEDSQQSSN